MNPLNPNTQYIITVDDQMFTVKIPTPAEQIQIKTAVSVRTGQVKVESLEPDVISYATIIETLNKVIIKYPDNFDAFNPLTQNWGHCHDTEYVVAVYEAFQEKELSFHETLKKNKDSRRASRNGVLAGSVHHAEISHSPAGNIGSRTVVFPTEDVSIGSGISDRGLPTSQEPARTHAETRPSQVERAGSVSPGRDGGSPLDDRLLTRGDKKAG